jgi:hypothetical protein
VLAALAVFGAFGSLQMILAALNVHLVAMPPAAPTSSHGVALVQASADPAPVALPAIARPVDPDASPASMPNVSSAREITLVSAEDARIRTLIHDSARAHQPEVVHSQGALATLILPARSTAYTLTDLVTQGAVVMLSAHAALLQQNLFVASGAQLSLGAPAVSSLYLASSTSGFTSIVGWGGSLSLTGTAAQPLTIMSWNQAAKSAVADKGAGRPYIREIGATMTLAYARVSSLGFWSGRTGGVAWTGTSRMGSKGSAVDSTFTGDTYGAFVSRGQDVTFSADRFESNELDGLHIHRNSAGSRVTSSSAARNGGNGFLVDRATRNTLLRGDVSQHNAANGYLFDGRPLVSGASASGGSNLPSSGTMLEDSSATGNAHTSVLIEGGTGTVVKSDQFCSPTTAIALRTGAANAVITGNYIDCDPRSGISVGPSAPGTVVFGNIVTHPSIGLLVRNSGAVSLYDNQIVGATVFGVSARTAASRVSGVGNVMSGTGARAVDVRTGASVSSLSGTNTAGWAHHTRVTFISYLQFHPLASLWLGILVVILLAAGWSFRRKLPDHPYPASVRRTYADPAPSGSSVAMDPYPALPSPAVRQTAVQRALGRPGTRPPRPPATRNAPVFAPPGRPQPMTRQQPTHQPAPSDPWAASQGPRPSGPRPAYQEPRPSGPRPAYQEPRPSGPRPAYQEPRPSGPRPAYREPAYREPTPDPRWRHEPPPEPPPNGWDRPGRDVQRRPRPTPARLPPAPLPPAPSRTSGGWPEMPDHRGGPVDGRVTRAQQALPSEANRSSGRERPADPPGDDVRVTRPVPKGVWD